MGAFATLTLDDYDPKREAPEILLILQIAAGIVIAVLVLANLNRCLEILTVVAVIAVAALFTVGPLALLGWYLLSHGLEVLEFIFWLLLLAIGGALLMGLYAKVSRYGFYLDIVLCRIVLAFANSFGLFGLAAKYEYQLRLLEGVKTGVKAARHLTNEQLEAEQRKADRERLGYKDE